jgi:hypothetical protein
VRSTASPHATSSSNLTGADPPRESDPIGGATLLVVHRLGRRSCAPGAVVQRTADGGHAPRPPGATRRCDRASSHRCLSLALRHVTRVATLLLSCRPRRVACRAVRVALSCRVASVVSRSVARVSCRRCRATIRRHAPRGDTGMWPERPWRVTLSAAWDLRPPRWCAPRRVAALTLTRRVVRSKRTHSVALTDQNFGLTAEIA